ncbi:pyridoxamine 5'-phosphate oxidase family protein [Streptomyces phaeochromogenes]|uniref:pyridoxamine 5'-phosphate oxidase family protein n=1 Tax=Streptomyces phaeochromogenes TaxID=1923 RepID=UPI00324721A7
MNTIGFHEGELKIQRQAGVEHEAARLEGMLRPPQLTGGAAAFLAQRDLAVLTARDRAGRMWTSPLFGAPGFLEGRDTALQVHRAPTDGDPLQVLPLDQKVGLLTIDFAIRRRFRVNGTLGRADHHGLLIGVEQAFGNCPAYIQQRITRLSPDAAPVEESAGPAAWTGSFTPEQVEVITGADTFFLGTTHPARGIDTSHKGGFPGFVRTDGPEPWWPDYAGNNMFNSMGNIAVDPTTSLLFIDFTNGAALHLSGTAELEWVTPGGPGDDDGTGRRVRFRPEFTSTTRLALAMGRDVTYSPHNPALQP